VGEIKPDLPEVKSISTPKNESTIVNPKILHK